jgi:hypothetical protein
MVVSHIQAPDVPDVEDALRALNKSGARQGRALGEKDESDQNDPANFSSDLAPSIVPLDHNDEVSAEELANDKPSLGKRFAGAIFGSIFVAAIAAFAWQAYSDNQIKTSWGSGKLKPSSDSPTNVATAPPLAPNPVAAEVPPEVLQQLRAIASDLGVVRQKVEEIASKQDQSSRDIASIQAAEQNLSK